MTPKAAAKKLRQIDERLAKIQNELDSALYGDRGPVWVNLKRLDRAGDKLFRERIRLADIAEGLDPEE